MSEDLSGLRRAAIVLLSLGEQRAGEMLRLLPEDDARTLRDEMARVGGLRGVSLRTRQRVLTDFCQAVAPLPSPPSIERMGDSVQLEQRARQRVGAVMNRAVRSIEADAVNEVLAAAEGKIENGLLEEIEEQEPDLVERLRRVQAVFDELLSASDEDICRVIEQVDAQTIAMALRTAHPSLIARVLDNLMPEESIQIARDIEAVAPVPVSEIEAAQQRVAEAVYRLEAAGETRLLARTHAGGR